MDIQYSAFVNANRAEKKIIDLLADMSDRWMRPDGFIDYDLAHNILIEEFCDNGLAILYIRTVGSDVIADKAIQLIEEAKVDAGLHQESMADCY